MTRLAALALALALALAVACATTTPSRAPAPAARASLEAFADALAREGMSVPLPPRVCDDDDGPADAAPRWRDDPGCLAVAHVARGPVDDRALLLAYAVALVSARLPGPEAPARAAEIVDAYRARDAARFAAAARRVEHDFDARRAAVPRVAPARSASRSPARVAPVTPNARAAEAARHPPAPAHDGERQGERRAAVDEGAGDGAGEGAGEAKRPGLRERLVGTWTYDEENVRNVYALCDDGAYAIRFELGPAADGDLGSITGTWSVRDDPPVVVFTSGPDTIEAAIVTLADDAVDVTIDSDTLHLSRRSKTATCD